MIDAVYTIDVSTFPLPYESLQLEGPETADFLQRQLMNDVRLLREDGSSQWTGLLSAKGKVVHLFLLLRLRADHYVAICPDQDAALLQAALQRMLFRSKLKLSLLPQAEVWHVPQPANTSASAQLHWQGERWLSWFEQAPSFPASAAPAQLGGLQQAWNLADLEAGLVRLQETTRDEFTPQMLGLERRKAFSLNKGCFPGQEILARTHFLGKAKRGLQLLACQGDVSCGSAILCDQREVGRVVSDALAEKVLAVLPLEQPEPLSNPQATFTYLSPTWSAG